ncbi:HAD-IA family hydrolase [Ancylobacter sp. 6x-1]|uniref:phosphoglycolate phosphatase n=1 Tax=Ancylobacter crimeensis TaxID=2579147 RepID=A0ABT0DAW0_9HYPH|nr:HAD-IA family hydrolase [Ancylobacter crimeensis]MCK0197095.1 HAD-IA family hydrolase [Ancylobacter crimeensis]
MSASPTIRAILFDKDGTLVDFDQTWGQAAGAVIRRITGGNETRIARLNEVSHYLPAQQRFLASSPLVAGSSREYGPLWAQVLERPADEALFNEINHLFGEEGRRFLTAIGTPAHTLARLRAGGLPLAIATNDTEGNARVQAELLGLTPLLDAIYGYDSGHGGKPGPGMVEAFIRRTGLPAEHVALVGDTRHDLLAAKAAGALAVLVRSGPSPVDAFADEADLVLDDIDALADHVLGGVRPQEQRARA